MSDFEDGNIVPVTDPAVDPAAPVDAPVDPNVEPTPAPEDPAPVEPVPADEPTPVDAPPTDAPAEPVASEDGIFFDKEIYAPGETVTATVKLASQLKTRTVTYVPASGEQITASFQVQENVGTVVDDGNGEWTLVDGSYEGDTAVFTTTA